MNLLRPHQFSRLSACVVLFALLPLKFSHASGIIKVESNGFLRKSEDRADSSSTVSIGPRIDGQGKVVEGKLDLEAIVQVSDTKNLTVDRSAFTVEAANAYLATSKSMITHHQFTVGRRVYDWSKFDDQWQFGMVSPRFIWDPTRPQTVGLTGVFHTYESKHWRVLSYASPLSIPERGYPVRSENGKLSSSNPFYNPLYDQAVISKRNIPVVYNVEYPPMSELLLNPGGSTSVRWSSEEQGKGYWVQGVYGYLPVHQANLAIQAQYVLAQDNIDVRVHPEIQRHHLLTAETGLEKKSFSLWGSVTEEVPTSRSVPSTWIATRSEPATLASVGGDVTFLPNWKLKGSYLYIREPRNAATENADFKVDLPGRFPYHKAARGGLEFQGSERMKYELSVLADIEYESQLATFQMTYLILKKDHALTLNLGSDFFASGTGKGYIGQYKGNDRFRGGISYAF